MRAEINKGGCSFEKPGIMTEYVEMFGKPHCNKSAKICIDGKQKINSTVALHMSRSIGM